MVIFTWSFVVYKDMFGAGLLMPQLANHAKQLGCSHIQIGTMSALYSGFQLISGPVVGSLSDTKGRKPILLLCLYICAFAYVSLGITSSITLFLLLRSVIGMSKQTQLLTNALAPDYETDGTKQSIVYGRMSTMTGLGMSVGPIIGGHIMEAYPNNGFTVICCVVGAIFIFNTFLLRKLPDVKISKFAKKQVTIPIKLLDSITKTAKESIDEFRKIDWSIFWDLFLFKLLITCCVGLYFSSFSLFLKIYHEVSPKELGYLIAFQGGMGSLCTYFIGHITKLYKHDEDFSQRMLHISLVLSFTLLGLSMISSIVIFVLLLIPFALCGSIGRVTTLEMIASRSKNTNRGTIIGASNSMKSLSGVITPLLGGFIGEYLGIAYNFYLASFVATAGAVAIKYHRTYVTSKNKSE